MLLNDIFDCIIHQKGKTFLREWFRECYSQLLPRIISLGLIFEIKFENIPGEDLKVSCKDQDDHIEVKKHRVQDAVEQVKGFARKTPYKKHLCKGNEVNTEDVEWVSRVVLAGDIIDHASGTGHEDYLDDMADSTKCIEIMKEIERRVKKGKRVGTLRGNFPIIWVTKSSELKNLIQNTDSKEVAAVVVDKLGMGQMTRGCLYEIQIPLRSLRKLHTPTVIDADFGKYFFPAKEPDKWGRTLQIETLQRCLPEAVHPSLALEKNFSFFHLGMLDAKPNEPATSVWESFYKRMINYLVEEYREYNTEHEELFGDLEG